MEAKEDGRKEEGKHWQEEKTSTEAQCFPSLSMVSIVLYTRGMSLPL